MSIATEKARIKGNVAAALSAIAEKGVTVPDGSTSDALASLIASIEAGWGGGYDFGGTAVEVVSGSFTVAEKTICNALFPEGSELQLPFQNTNTKYKQRGRWFFLWDITQTSNKNSTAANIYSNWSIVK